MAAGGEQTMCIVERLDGKLEIPLGETLRVMLTLPSGELYDEHLLGGMDVRIQEGARIVAEGRVLSVLR